MGHFVGEVGGSISQIGIRTEPYTGRFSILSRQELLASSPLQVRICLDVRQALRGFMSPVVCQPQ
jgi:hypothetical protein